MKMQICAPLLHGVHSMARISRRSKICSLAETFALSPSRFQVQQLRAAYPSEMLGVSLADQMVARIFAQA
jgi:hypothetical protein